jgi:hypothetical protein
VAEPVFLREHEVTKNKGIFPVFHSTLLFSKINQHLIAQGMPACRGCLQVLLIFTVH